LVLRLDAAALVLRAHATAAVVRAAKEFATNNQCELVRL